MVSPDSPTTPTPDIAIIGGGPSGLALAGICEKAGISYIVYEKYARDSIPLGGSLDLVEGSGQLAMEEAGVSNWREYGRGGNAMVHCIWDHKGNRVYEWGRGKDAPELDRFQIKMALLQVVPEEKIRWSAGLVKAERNANGKIVLHLADGSMATGFKLVVGADGTWSKVRPLITSTVPKHSGIVYLTGTISKANPHYAKTYSTAKEGPMIVMGRETNIWNQMQGDGHYRVDCGFLRPANFHKSGRFDINDTKAVKELLLSEEFFGHHGGEIKDIIRAIEGPFRAWPLWYMPPEEMTWDKSPRSDVALIGDAAHTTTPFVGEGANSAMRDAVILVRCIQKYAIGGGAKGWEKAIAEYEKDMLPYGRDVIERSLASGDLFFDFDSPKAFGEGMKDNPVIKNMLLKYEDDGVR